jgi:hypothetical protein
MDNREPETPEGVPPARRTFLARVGGLGAATLAGVVVPPMAGGKRATAEAAGNEAVGGRRRQVQAYQLRQQAALRLLRRRPAAHPTNGDEDLYYNRIGSYGKCLPHDAQCHIDPAAYNAFLTAMNSGLAADFEVIPMGGTVKLANPQSAYAFDLEGFDSNELGLPAPPAFASPWQASEMAEDYWMALTRDVPFTDYETSPLIQIAAADLSAFSDFRGPTDGGRVTPATLFRGDTPGDVNGPFLSQFLWRDIPYGPLVLQQKYRSAPPGADYMTSFADCLARQRGVPAAPGPLEATPRYIRNGRDMAEWLHRDNSLQGGVHAALMLLAMGPGALDTANPYLASLTQGSFVTFGPPFVLDMVARVANASLRACWYQKWLVHRRIRPEAFGAHVHNQITGEATTPIHAELLNSAAVDAVFSAKGTYLLPQAYPEGSPTHPSYPAGHACFIGACVTMCKALFKESFVIPAPVVANADGSALLPYVGPDLTVGGELNKLAANVALGRDVAGIHWRTDGSEGLRLGEAVTIGVLEDMRATYHEAFAGFSLTKFDGTTITV